MHDRDGDDAIEVNAEETTKLRSVRSLINGIHKGVMVQLKTFMSQK